RCTRRQLAADWRRQPHYAGADRTRCRLGGCVICHRRAEAAAGNSAGGVPMKVTAPNLPRWVRQIGWRTVVGAALLAGIVHPPPPPAVPLLGPGNAFRKLRDTLPVNQMVFLPPPTPNTQLLPYVAADALYAACRYDVSAGSVAVTAMLADPGWTLSL